MGKVDDFEKFRKDINEKILQGENLDIKRFFALDSSVYQEGVLPARIKELMGLVASMVLRCDDCITYHILQAEKAGVTRKELEEAFSIALVVGGSIVIPHLRRAVALLEEIDL